MVPIFTSHYSIGKSILTLNSPDKEVKGGSRSVFSIAKDNNLKQVCLVENSLTGFPEALANSKKAGIQLSFGLQLNICEQNHKVIIFAKNGAGARKLNEIYSRAFSGEEQCVCPKDLIKTWTPKNLLLAIPFYDSFIYKNTMSFENCTPDLAELDPLFFIERNGLPFDGLLEEKVKGYAKSFGFKTLLAKSIFYDRNEDADALQTYKCITSRRFGKSTLSKPNLDHFGSNEFSFESFLDNERITTKV
jgi:DNA polymerase III alpha subunit